MGVSKRKAIAAMTMVATLTLNGMRAAAGGQDAAQPQKAPAASHGKLIATYHGVLPCADCPGIDTTVKLFAATPNDSHGVYVIHNVYQERKRSYNETGTWTMEKGTPDNASASVYVLKPKTGNGVTNFLRVGVNEIKQLDKDRKPFAGTVNFSLKRVNTAPPADPGKPAI
jgi:copper homeostasis protein (lipoprotein)